MSNQVPVAAPAIPHPMQGSTQKDSIESLFQSTLAIKANIELAQGTRGTAFAAQLHGPTANQIALAAALLKVT